MSTVHNGAIDNLRRSALREDRTVSDDGLAERLEAEDRTDGEVQRREDSVVHHALSRLPDDQRQVIELAYFSGLTHSEIAERLALPQGTVEGRMRLGLAKLTAALEDPAEVLSGA